MNTPDKPHPADRPRTYLSAFVVLMATAVVFPDGFELVSLAAGALLVIVWLALLLIYPKHPNHDDTENRSP